MCTLKWYLKHCIICKYYNVPHDKEIKHTHTHTHTEQLEVQWREREQRSNTNAGNKCAWYLLEGMSWGRLNWGSKPRLRIRQAKNRENNCSLLCTQGA